MLDLWKRHNDHYGRSATGRAAVPALPPPWTGYPRFCAASGWGATAGLSHGRQCRASRSRRAAPAVGVDCETHHPRSILLEGGWSTPEPAGRAVWAARGRQRRYPPASTSQSFGLRNFPSDPERIPPQAPRGLTTLYTVLLLYTPYIIQHLKMMIIIITKMYTYSK